MRMRIPIGRPSPDRQRFALGFPSLAGGTALLMSLLAAGPALADAFAARVNAIKDGATLTVTDARSRQQRQVRLLGVEAPVRTSPFGNASRTALSGLLFERDVRIEPAKQDGTHIVGKVIVLANPACDGPRCPGTDAGLQQIRTGMAAWARRDAEAQALDDRGAYQQAEFAAQIRRLGVWSESRRRERP